MLFCISTSPDRGLAASASLGDYFAGFVAERRRRPGDDVISDLVQADIDGERLDDEAVCAFLRILLTGGADTTYRGSGSALFLLLTHPEQLEAVANDRKLVGQAIEEALRFEPPAVGIFRRATVDTEIGGVPIPAGSDVYTVIASANHDESRWDDPERFDIFRDQHQHMTFAQGPHMCLGVHLARIETRIMLEAVLDRLHGLRLDPDAADPYMHGIMFRSPTAVPVLFAS